MCFEVDECVLPKNKQNQRRFKRNGNDVTECNLAKRMSNRRHTVVEGSTIRGSKTYCIILSSLAEVGGPILCSAVMPVESTE